MTNKALTIKTVLLGAVILISFYAHSQTSTGIPINIPSSQWFYIKSDYGMVKQIDLARSLDMRKNGNTIIFKTITRDDNYYPDLGYFNIILEEYSLQCPESIKSNEYSMILRSYSLYTRQGKLIKNERTLSKPISVDASHILHNICSGEELTQFQKGLIMSEEATQRQLNKEKR
ncbi:hypothetical protein [Hafnia alvei]|uniref:hypothetical protein n=1 Tax=Hafnia alvei TaxID=569 RepID=UPI001033DAE4|nr:hypothetical protein [Hafnia alvei]TBL90129.1 hypothetical protein EYY88_01320 [Hafnia alvei]